MKIEQIYTGCLSQGAYYIESEGEVAIIDPLRDIDIYLEKAKENNARIKYVFETHFHADFVSGHKELAEKSGATIIYGPGASTSFKMENALDGQEYKLGKIKIKALHTPGHTLESTCYLLFDEDNKAHAIFTGDTLFIGDVGRPDLAIKSDLSREDLAGMLYDSLRQKIMTLPGEVIVYPAHGAGSACGKNLSKDTSDLLSNQLLSNYALRSDMSKSEFIEEVTTGILPPPQYFAKNAKLNQMGADNLETVKHQGITPLSVSEFQNMQKSNSALVLDTRTPFEFAQSHIPGSIFIGLGGDFAPWVGALIKDLNQPIIFISSPGREEEVVTRLSRVGYDNTLGYLEGGLGAWEADDQKVESIKSISAKQFEHDIDEMSINILDVRNNNEFQSEHVVGAYNFPLDYINSNLQDLSKDKTFYVHCAGGYRSMIASSILKLNGFGEIINVEGGLKAIKSTKISTSVFICPTSLN